MAGLTCSLWSFNNALFVIALSTRTKTVGSLPENALDNKEDRHCQAFI